MKQCFGYVRVSTQKQGEGVSLEAQREAISAFALRNNITIIRWFEEKVTAAKKGRPAFNAMVTQLRRGKAAGLVVHKIDRSARNFADWARIGDLADAGIDVHFATESLDFRSRGGRLAADIQAVVAADYIRNLREETLKGINGRLKQGLYPFRAPIGYVDNGGGKPKTLDPSRSPFVRQAFELYASGQHSLRSLRAELERRGLRTEHDKPLSKRGVETVLANPFYCGIIRIKTTGATYQGAHEPLISAHLFETVQDVRADKSGKKVTRHNHTYRGLFRCRYCRAAMTPERQKGHVYYRCQTPACATKCVREEKIETEITKTLARVRMTDEDVVELTDAFRAWRETEREPSAKKSIELRLVQINARIERLTDALVDRLIDQDTFNARQQRLLLDKACAEEALAEAAKKHDEPSRVRKFLELAKSLADMFISAIPEEKRRIAEWATSNRSVAGGNVYLEPSNWLIAVEQMLGVFGGEPYRPTSRTFEQRLEGLVADFEQTLKDEEIDEEDARKWSGGPVNDNDQRRAAWSGLLP